MVSVIPSKGEHRSYSRPGESSAQVVPGDCRPIRVRDPVTPAAWDVPASLKEFGGGVEKLGMKGLLRDTSLAGKFPDDPESRPVFRRAAERGTG